MNCLIIDCSSGMKVYVLKDDIVYSKIDENQKKHTDELLVAVDELFLSAGVSPNDLDVVAVCVGPGSFTGVRVAVSICKGLAVESKTKIVTVSNFDVFEEKLECDHFVVLDGFSEYVYVRKNLDGNIEDCCVNLNEFAEEYLSKFSNIEIYAGDEKTQKRLENVKILSKNATNDTILCVKRKITMGEFVDINQINPVYLRASQAEIERDKKLKNLAGK